MDKKVILLSALAALGAAALAVFRSPERKTAQAEELFPAEKFRGYVENTQVKIVNRSKPRMAGGPLLAMAVTPFGIQAEQVSPTGYGALKALHKQFPDAEWIAVFIAEDSLLAETSNWAGLAEYRKGAVTVTGGLPSQASLDSLAKLGQPARRPTREDLRAVAAVFDSSGDLSSARWDLSQSLLGSGGGQAMDRSHFLDLAFETRAVHAAAKAAGKSPKDAQALVQSTCRYYWLRAGEPL